MNATIATFFAQVGTQCVAHTHAGLVVLRLVEAVERPRRGLPDEFKTPISLVFEGPQTPQLTQDNYTLDHPALGRNVWMLVPITSPHGASGAPWYQVLLG